jgi:putative oxidoreductase
VAAISYPDLSNAGMEDHYIWGIMLLALIANGSGKLSVDNLIVKRFFNKQEMNTI